MTTPSSTISDVGQPNIPRLNKYAVWLEARLTLVVQSDTLGDLDGTLPDGEVRRSWLQEEEWLWYCTVSSKSTIGSVTHPWERHCPALWHGRRSYAQ